MLIATKLISSIILITGLALITRTLLLVGGISLSAGMVAGLAFTAYGAVRLYYLKGTH